MRFLLRPCFYPHDNRFDPARLPSCSAKIPVLDGTHITHILQMARVKDVVLRSVWATESYCKTFQASRLAACATKNPARHPWSVSSVLQVAHVCKTESRNRSGEIYGKSLEPPRLPFGPRPDAIVQGNVALCLANERSR